MCPLDRAKPDSVWARTSRSSRSSVTAQGAIVKLAWVITSGCLPDFGGRVEPLHLDGRQQAVDLARVDQPRAQALRRLGAAGPPEAQAGGRGRAGVARRDEA